jgi:hypothetical protein
VPERIGWHAPCVTRRVRAGAAAIGFLCAVGCGMQQRPTREPILPELEPATPVMTYNTRVVALRTSLGRSAITLELRGANDVVRSAACDEPVSQRLQLGCARCELAGDGDPFDSAVLDTIISAFDRYPAQVLDATHIERVTLCRNLSYEDLPDEKAIGTVDLRSRRLFISVAPFLHRQYDATGAVTTDDIVHHELFHLFEYERMREAYSDDPEWRLQNPLGFEYRSDGDKDDRKAGFINEYASTSEVEDRASVYQYLLARPGELCSIAAGDAGVRAKTRLLWRRISSLVGGAFLRENASCVLPWLDDVEPLPLACNACRQR